jgi:hypothetical protein
MAVPVTAVARVGEYAPHEFGLFSAADVETHGDSNFASGETQWLDWCGQPRVHPRFCRPGESPGESPGDIPLKEPREGTFASSRPFLLEYMPQCAIFSPGLDIAATARDVFDAGEQTAAEAEFWVNVLASDSSEYAVDCVALTPDPGPDYVFAAQALGEVEQQVHWRYPGRGVIHVPAFAAYHLTNLNAIRFEGGRAFTQLGTPVAFGVGYFGEPGSGEATAGFHIVGTGNVRVDRGPLVDPPTVIDTATNTQTKLVERDYSIGFGCVCVTALVAGPTPAPLPLDV